MFVSYLDAIFAVYLNRIRRKIRNSSITTATKTHDKSFWLFTCYFLLLAYM